MAVMGEVSSRKGDAAGGGGVPLVEIEGQSGGSEGLDAALSLKTKPLQPLSTEEIAHVADDPQGRPTVVPSADLNTRQPHDVHQLPVSQAVDGSEPRRGATRQTLARDDPVKDYGLLVEGQGSGLAKSLHLNGCRQNFGGWEAFERLDFGAIRRP